jgi:hypothetical protein
MPTLLLVTDSGISKEFKRSPATMVLPATPRSPIERSWRLGASGHHPQSRTHSTPLISLHQSQGMLVYEKERADKRHTG